MQELVRLRAADFEMAIWCASVTARQDAYDHTLGKRKRLRKASYPLMSTIPASQIKISIPGSCLAEQHGKGTMLELREPLFFENNQYHFEWIFTDIKAGIGAAEVVHNSRKVVEGFRFAKARSSIPARLTGSVSTANNVGWMTLKIRYETLSGVVRDASFAMEVQPAKMDLDSDLPVMYRKIDASFPLWRFKLSEITQFGVSRGKSRGDFELMWLANFNQLRIKFERALKVIENAPHTKLQPEVRNIRAARIKGRVYDRTARKIVEDIRAGRFDKKYSIHRKKLSSDTPENRFVKMAVEKCSNRLTELELRLRRDNNVPDRQRLSDSFFMELAQWRRPLKGFLRNNFIQEAGSFEGLSGQETALQRKSGYSAVYRCWQELKYYLDAFADESRISLKSVAEIYEVWCFLEIRSILIDELGFTEKVSSQSGLVMNDFYEYQLQDGYGGAFEFERSDGVIAKLAHEPGFSKKSRKIKSFLVTQKPDILLEIEIPGNENGRLIWLFDAKYRVKVVDESAGDDGIDYVPEDALNQMHRYRDALISIVEVERDTLSSKSRPVIGAFALYPGYFDQSTDKNPYDIPIREVGIGAFALLPTDTGESGRLWLTKFLWSEIGERSKTDKNRGSGNVDEGLYIRETARIPYEGMQQVLYSDLVMTSAIGGAKGRNRDYIKRFNDGTARWYHIPQARFKDKNNGYHIVYEIRYFGLAVNSKTEQGTRCIERVWPVNGVELVPRYMLSEEQAGKQRESDELFYLFELGRPLTLKEPITRVPLRQFRPSVKLTTLKLLENASVFNDVESVYLGAMT